MGDAALSISIVIPTLNAGRAFGTVLHRIMGQGQVPLEIVCADMGSTDGTRHIVSQFPLARFVEIAEPPGPKSWNRAMEVAHGDVVVFLAQDAVPGNGDWLTHLTAPFTDPSVGGVYGRHEASMESDPLSGFRLGERFCREAHWRRIRVGDRVRRSEEHTSELQSPCNLVCRLLLEKKKISTMRHIRTIIYTFQH